MLYILMYYEQHFDKKRSLLFVFLFFLIIFSFGFSRYLPLKKHFANEITNKHFVKIDSCVGDKPLITPEPFGSCYIKNNNNKEVVVCSSLLNFIRWINRNRIGRHLVHINLVENANGEKIAKIKLFVPKIHYSDIVEVYEYLDYFADILEGEAIQKVEFGFLKEMEEMKGYLWWYKENQKFFEKTSVGRRFLFESPLVFEEYNVNIVIKPGKNDKNVAFINLSNDKEYVVNNYKRFAFFDDHIIYMDKDISIDHPLWHLYFYHEKNKKSLVEEFTINYGWKEYKGWKKIPLDESCYISKDFFVGFYRKSIMKKVKKRLNKFVEKFENAIKNRSLLEVALSGLQPKILTYNNKKAYFLVYDEKRKKEFFSKFLNVLKKEREKPVLFIKRRSLFSNDKASRDYSSSVLERMIKDLKQMSGNTKVYYEIPEKDIYNKEVLEMKRVNLNFYSNDHSLAFCSFSKNSFYLGYLLSLYYEKPFLGILDKKKIENLKGKYKKIVCIWDNFYDKKDENVYYISIPSVDGFFIKLKEKGILEDKAYLTFEFLEGDDIKVSELIPYVLYVYYQNGYILVLPSVKEMSFDDLTYDIPFFSEVYEKLLLEKIYEKIPLEFVVFGRFGKNVPYLWMYRFVKTPNHFREYPAVGKFSFSNYVLRKKFTNKGERVASHLFFPNLAQFSLYLFREKNLYDLFNIYYGRKGYVWLSYVIHKELTEEIEKLAEKTLPWGIYKVKEFTSRVFEESLREYGSKKIGNKEFYFFTKLNRNKDLGVYLNLFVSPEKEIIEEKKYYINDYNIISSDGVAPSVLVWEAHGTEIGGYNARDLIEDDLVKLDPERYKFIPKGYFFIFASSCSLAKEMVYFFRNFFFKSAPLLFMAFEDVSTLYDPRELQKNLSGFIANNLENNIKIKKTKKYVVFSLSKIKGFNYFIYGVIYGNGYYSPMLWYSTPTIFGDIYVDIPLYVLKKS